MAYRPRPPQSTKLSFSRSSRGVGYPHQPAPSSAAAVVRCEVARRNALQSQSVHHCLRSPIVWCRVGDDLPQPYTPESVVQYRSGSFGRVTVAPGVPHQPPADLEMETQRMVWTRGHYPGVAQEVSASAIDSPTAESMLAEGRRISVELASLAARLIGPPRSSITSGSAFISANVSWSARRQQRSRKRGVSIITSPPLVRPAFHTWNSTRARATSCLSRNWISN